MDLQGLKSLFVSGLLKEQVKQKTSWTWKRVDFPWNGSEKSEFIWWFYTSDQTLHHVWRSPKNPWVRVTFSFTHPNKGYNLNHLGVLHPNFGNRGTYRFRKVCTVVKHMYTVFTYSIPSRELTYPPKNAILKRMFLCPRWDMLVLWRVYMCSYFSVCCIYIDMIIYVFLYLHIHNIYFYLEMWVSRMKDFP